MLSSIHPLGERSRGQRFPITATAYIVGSTAAGAGLGTLLGLIGAALTPSPVGDAAALIIIGVVAALGLGHDLWPRHVRLPMPHRQVDEDWLVRYRGWVYGFGFGAQLGVGIATIITTGLVYLTWSAALLSGQAATGLIIGATFGATRALVILAVARVATPAQLHTAHRRLDRLRQGAGRAAVATLAVGLTATALAALT